ncbi:MAG TPA: tail fiber protein [Methylomirabilota bacterium]|nr:tail fiber protein [Methylomirabilota bacterium]
MSSPFVGEIRMFAGNFAPAGWAFCDGSLIPISENETLFQLIGTTYGGDGENTFALPDLRGRVPVHVGPGFALGQAGGAETVTLTVSQIPAHAHVPQCSAGAGSQQSPGGAMWASPSVGTIYSSASPSLAMDPAGVGPGGGSQPHDNMIPFLAVNFILSQFGVFPTQ